MRIFIKEENPLLVRGLGFLLRKNKEENPLLLQEAHAMQAIEHSMHSRHFPSENKEENPLLLQRQSHFAPQNKEDL